MKRHKVKIGQVAAVPLPERGGYCRVVVARADKFSRRGDRGVLLYGFAPHFRDTNDAVALRTDDLDPWNAIDICETSGILISRGEWPVIGLLPLKRVLAWTFPRFITFHDTFGEWQEVPYSASRVMERNDRRRIFLQEDPKTRQPILDTSDTRPIARYGVPSAFGIGDRLEYILERGWKGHPPFNDPIWGR